MAKTRRSGQDGAKKSQTYGLKWHDSTTEPGSHLRKLPVIDRKVDFCVFKHQRARLRAEMKNGSGNSSGAPPRGPSGARSQSAPTAGAQFAPTATPATTTPPSSLRHPPSRVDAPIVFWISQLFCSGPPCRKRFLAGWSRSAPDRSPPVLTQDRGQDEDSPKASDKDRGSLSRPSSPSLGGWSLGNLNLGRGVGLLVVERVSH